MARARLILLLLAGCSGPAADASAGHDSGALAGPSLEPPAHGIQLTTIGRAIPAGADEEWCEVIEVPGASDRVFFVGRTEIAMTPFSHHLTVSMAPEGSALLDAAPLGEPARCAGAHLYGTGLVTLAAAAKPYVARQLPSGIGFELRGGQRLVVDYHAFNTGAEPFRVAHQLNLHFVDAVAKRSRIFGFYNQAIEVPAHSERAFASDCRFQDDVSIWSLSRHTHRYGTDFRVWWAGGERDGEPIWTSTDWESEIEHHFDTPVVVPAGVGFRWQCTFVNTTDQTLTSGPQATDEMCILFGSFAALGDDAQVGPQSCYRFGL